MMNPRQVRKWTAILAGAAALYTAGNLYQPTVVLGHSMDPTLKTGSVIWVDRTYYRLHRPRPGEVVVFRQDGTTYVKRIYRGPGETLHYLGDGREWLGPVRDSRAEELRRRYARQRGVWRINELRVPDDAVFVLGDNYLCSVDSRELGPIPIANIIGRAHLPVDVTGAMRFEFAPRSTRSRVTRNAPRVASGA